MRVTPKEKQNSRCFVLILTSGFRFQNLDQLCLSFLQAPGIAEKEGEWLFWNEIASSDEFQDPAAYLARQSQTSASFGMAEDVKPSEDAISVVNECVASLEKIANLKSSAERSLYVGTLEKLQVAVCTEETSMKHFISNFGGGIPLLVGILEKSQDQHIKHFVVLIMEKMMLRKSDGMDHSQSFVLHGVIDHLLKLILKYQTSWGDDFICSLYKVTAKIADEDKKFAVKARFLGVLPVIVSHIKTYAKRPKVLNAIMKLLKKVMGSSVNATKLCKDGLPKELLHFLDDPKKTTILPVLEAISEATRSRHAARQFIKDDIIPRILHIIFNTAPSGSSRLHSSICKTCLRILIHLTQLKNGREKLIAAGTVSSLLAWCGTLLEVPGFRYNNLVILVSSVLQRCLPSRSLPVRKLSNPVLFTLTENYCHNESDSSEGKNDDASSLASSNFSSVDSASDTDEEVRPLDIIDPSYVETNDQICLFFQELNECHQTQFSSNEEIQDDYLVNDFFEKFVPSPVLELKEVKFHSKIPKIIPRRPNPATLKKEVLSPLGDISDFVKENPQRYTLSNKKVISTTAFTPQSFYLLPSENDEVILNEHIDEARTYENYCDRMSFLHSTDMESAPFSLTNAEKCNLLESAREERRNQRFLENVNVPEVYHKQASHTVSVTPFIKLAFPDIVSGLSKPEPDVPLLKCDLFLMRQKMYKNSQEMSQSDYFYTEIYNLDSLLHDNYPNASSLFNKDEQLITSEKCCNHLEFESRFESGNLRKVFWKGYNEYDLILNPDINCKGHLQWFYFQVSGMQANFLYTFNIINMEKSTSHFNEGMCPVLFSVRNFVEKKQGWIRAGSDICYFRNHYTQTASASSAIRNKAYYTLTFSIAFQHANDVCYIAYHYPYTYTTLQTHLHCWLNSYDTSLVYVRKDDLCKTLSGNSVPLLTITAKPLDDKRPYIFLTARVHPGESNSSWVMKGTLDFLLSNKAQKLRETFIFKIVPMLNPDGVINGCHRCSLSGQDLNRQWIAPSSHTHPTIYHTKSLLHYLASINRKPLVFCDFHGHSRRSNAFFFGCNPEQSWWPSDETKLDCESFKVLPVLMNEMAPTFSLDDCKFTIERNRESTGRVTVWRQFDVPLSYTLECSYGGCNQGKYSGFHIGIPQLEDTGIKLCHCLGKLAFDLESYMVWSSLPVDLKNFPSSSCSSRILRSKMYASSTETDDEFEDYDDSDQLH